MIFELFHINWGDRKACVMAYDEAHKYAMLFFDLDQKVRVGNQVLLPKELKPGMKFELTSEEIERAKTSA